VACVPIVMATPATKSICLIQKLPGQMVHHRRCATAGNVQQMDVDAKLTLPMASRPLSKKNTTPRKVNRNPKPVSPTPISAGVTWNFESIKEGHAGYPDVFKVFTRGAT
jgi:hypothetical protein